jgi:hypothetical protein
MYIIIDNFEVSAYLLYLRAFVNCSHLLIQGNIIKRVWTNIEVYGDNVGIMLVSKKLKVFLFLLRICQITTLSTLIVV